MPGCNCFTGRYIILIATAVGAPYVMDSDSINAVGYFAALAACSLQLAFRAECFNI